MLQFGKDALLYFATFNRWVYPKYGLSARSQTVHEIAYESPMNRIKSQIQFKTKISKLVGKIRDSVFLARNLLDGRTKNQFLKASSGH